MTNNGLWGWMNSGAKPGDSDEERLKKAILTLIASGIAVLAIFWGLLYVVSGYPLSGAIPLTYAVISFLSIGHFFVTRRFTFFRSSQFMMILLLPFLLMWSLGGFANGSAVMIWAFFTPLAALFFAAPASAMRWLSAFVVLIVISALVDAEVARYADPMPGNLNTLYFLMNIGCGFLLIFVVLHFFVKDRQASSLAAIEAREEAERARQELEQAYEKVRRNEKKITELMLTDPLTGVANRRALNERLLAEIDRARRYDDELGVIMADLDWFKSINDNYGHAVGDEVLRSFARVMRDNVRSSDFIARFGGEEFVVIVPETSREGLLVTATHIQQAMLRQQIDGLDKSVTASFGLSLLGAADDVDSLLLRADRALYESKHQGRNTVTQID